MINGKKVAFITGIGGQDGSYLAEFLLSKGYLVRGIIRRASLPNEQRIEHLDIHGEYPDSPYYTIYADLSDAVSIRNALEEFKPDEIYNLGAQSHVGISFKNPESTINFNLLGTLRILEAIKDMKLNCRFYQASSSEMFGISSPPQNEGTPMLPQSPYGISKLGAFHLTKMYRNAYGIFASNGILFNHESPRRGWNFVTKKITRELANILVGEKKKIVLGNLDAKRDWGYSKEYVEGMWRILQHNEPDDFVIATQETHTVKDFVKEAFGLFDLDWENFVEIDEKYKRPAEVHALLGDGSKIKRILNWEPKTKFKDLVKMMVIFDLKEKLEQTGNLPIDGVKKSDDFYIERGMDLAEKLKLRNG